MWRFVSAKRLFRDLNFQISVDKLVEHPVEYRTMFNEFVYENLNWSLKSLLTETKRLIRLATNYYFSRTE